MCSDEMRISVKSELKWTIRLVFYKEKKYINKNPKKSPFVFQSTSFKKGRPNFILFILKEILVKEGWNKSVQWYFKLWSIITSLTFITLFLLICQLANPNDSLIPIDSFISRSERQRFFFFFLSLRLQIIT